MKPKCQAQVPIRPHYIRYCQCSRFAIKDDPKIGDGKRTFCAQHYAIELRRHLAVHSGRGQLTEVSTE